MQPLLSNIFSNKQVPSETVKCNNRGTVENGVFYEIRAKEISGTNLEFSSFIREPVKRKLRAVASQRATK
jgi:hypothetical protein